MDINNASVDSAAHGIYNTGTITAKTLSVKNATKNGLYNASGSFTADGLTISNTGEYGVNNGGTFSGVGKLLIQNTTKNGIQNSGTIPSLDGLKITNSSDNGIYNASGKSITAENLEIAGCANNGINNSGTIDVTGAAISQCKGKAIFNGGTAAVRNATINGESTSTQTSVVDVNGSSSTLTLSNSTINSAKTDALSLRFSATVIVDALTIHTAGQYGVNNDTGTLKGSGLNIDGTTNNSIFNNGTITGLSGVSVTNAGSNAIQNEVGKTAAINGFTIVKTKNNGIYNKGTFDVTNLTVKNLTNGQGVNNAGTFTATNVVIDNIQGTKHGIYSYNTSTVNLTLSGNITISNVSDRAIYARSGNFTFKSGSVVNTDNNIRIAGTLTNTSATPVAIVPVITTAGTKVVEAASSALATSYLQIFYSSQYNLVQSSNSLNLGTPK